MSWTVWFRVFKGLGGSDGTRKITEQIWSRIKRAKGLCLPKSKRTPAASKYNFSLSRTSNISCCLFMALINSLYSHFFTYCPGGRVDSEIEWKSVVLFSTWVRFFHGRTSFLQFFKGDWLCFRLLPSLYAEKMMSSAFHTTCLSPFQQRQTTRTWWRKWWSVLLKEQPIILSPSYHPALFLLPQHDIISRPQWAWPLFTDWITWWKIIHPSNNRCARLSWVSISWGGINFFVIMDKMDSLTGYRADTKKYCGRIDVKVSFSHLPY